MEYSDKETIRPIIRVSREQAAFVAGHHTVLTSYAEFAFLAACHTGEPTNGSPVVEALHPTAAMQSRRFRSVIATVWAMADADGRGLAGTFHKSVFSPADNYRVCYYERTAEALQDAAMKLRRKVRGLTLECWVNFVQYGA